MLSIDDIRAALARQTPGRLDADSMYAAVALVLAGRGPGLDLCVIRRADKPGDPWSGHLAFPGGRRAPDDADPYATAERETAEEVGLRLRVGQRQGGLAPLFIRLGGSGRSLHLFAAVYHLDSTRPPVTLNEEVAAAYWMPLAHAWDVRNAARLRLPSAAAVLSYPAIRFRDQMLWGISLRVLTLFSDVVGRPLPHFEEIPGLGR